MNGCHPAGADFLFDLVASHGGWEIKMRGFMRRSKMREALFLKLPGDLLQSIKIYQRTTETNKEHGGIPAFSFARSKSAVYQSITGFSTPGSGKPSIKLATDVLNSLQMARRIY